MTTKRPQNPDGRDSAANACHGQRRTNEDKRRAVMVLLNDAEWGKWSDNEVARRAGVSQPFVSGLRPKPEPSYNDYKIPETRTVQRGGTIYQQNTGNIGHSRPAAPPPLNVVYGETGAPKSAHDTEGKPLAVAWPTLEGQGSTPQPCPLKPADLLGFPG